MFSTYNTEDNRGSWILKVLMSSVPVASNVETNNNIQYSTSVVFRIDWFLITFKSCLTDAHLVQKVYHYGQFGLSLGKESCYTFSKFNLLNTDNLLIIMDTFLVPTLTL